MLRHPNSNALLAYWRQIRGSAPSPSRQAFDPAAIPQALPSVFLLEAGTGPSTFRLAGTGVCAAHRRELRDFRFSSLWSERDSRQAETVADMVARGGSGAAIVSTASTEMEDIEFETLLLPLLDREGRPGLAVGAMSHFGKPWSLGAKPLGDHLLVSLRVLFAGGGGDGEPLPGQADVIDFRSRAAVRSGRRIGHLTLIEGGAG